MLNDWPPTAKHFIDVVSLKVFTRYYCFYFAFNGIFCDQNANGLLKSIIKLVFFPESKHRLFQQID